MASDLLGCVGVWPYAPTVTWPEYRNGKKSDLDGGLTRWRTETEGDHGGRPYRRLSSLSPFVFNILLRLLATGSGAYRTQAVFHFCSGLREENTGPGGEDTHRMGRYFIPIQLPLYTPMSIIDSAIKRNSLIGSWSLITVR